MYTQGTVAAKKTDQFLLGVTWDCFHQHQGMSTASVVCTHVPTCYAYSCLTSKAEYMEWSQNFKNKPHQELYKLRACVTSYQWSFAVSKTLPTVHCVCTGDADTMWLLRLTLVLASPLGKQVRLNWHFNTMCNMISICDRLLFSVIQIQIQISQLFLLRPLQSDWWRIIWPLKTYSILKQNYT